jgi:hypothetical protein
VTDITYITDSDLCHIYTGKYQFSIPASNLDRLRYGLEAHYTQTKILEDATPEELAILRKMKPRNNALDEINYQIGRKGYNLQVILANDLVSRLPYMSQARNRNGKQNIADARWKNAIKNNNKSVIWLTNYYKYEEMYIKIHFPDVKWTKGSFAISPCHIYPAKKNRGEESWTPDKIVRDLSIINKAFDKISSSPLAGKHATNKEEANIALDYLESFDFNDLSTTRQILYMVLEQRVSNGFYNSDKFSDKALNL